MNTEHLLALSSYTLDSNPVRYLSIPCARAETKMDRIIGPDPNIDKQTKKNPRPTLPEFTAARGADMNSDGRFFSNKKHAANPQCMQALLPAGRLRRLVITFQICTSTTCCDPRSLFVLLVTCPSYRADKQVMRKHASKVNLWGRGIVTGYKCINENCRANHGWRTGLERKGKASKRLRRGPRDLFLGMDETFGYILVDGVICGI
ncbi:hypothetical protein V8C43DRAFT_291139 [Trichoderma afarasin]